jgi:hypothetical protein
MNCRTLPPIGTTPLLFTVQIPHERETVNFDLRLNGTLWSRHGIRLREHEQLKASS